MKKLMIKVELIFFIIISITSCSFGVLTGYEKQSFIDDHRFGCIWKGGMSAELFCSCRENTEVMSIEENTIPSYDTSQIHIQNCAHVIFGTNAIKSLRNLRTIHLNNIDNLEFQQHSLQWYGYREHDQFEERYNIEIPSVKIIIENSKINKISSYTFEGRLNTILFDNITIEYIEPFAFNLILQNQRILIRNSELKNIRAQPFKKFSTENFELDGVKIDIIPSRFLSNLTVYGNFFINNCQFNAVSSGAFIVSNPKKFVVSNTKINHLYGEAFKVTARGQVLFQNNIFDKINDGAFHGIDLNHEEITTKPYFIFDSNIFTTLTRDSLNVNQNDFQPEFNNLNINESCDCRNIDHNIKMNEFYPNIKCLFNNEEYITIKDYKDNYCSIIKSYSTTIIIVGVVFTMFIIIGTSLVIYYKKVYLSRKYGSNGKKQQQKGNMSLIVPDGRTYRETELHVIVERADLLTTDL